MSHIKVMIPATAGEPRDIIIAVLSGEGFDGFEEEEALLSAFVPEVDFDEAMLNELAEQLSFTYTTEAIAQRNWNELWESGFDPVVVDGFCTIKAHFHEAEITTPYVIVITPKMSFGTGHHATTQLMMMGMQDMDLKGKEVLDFGTGTGVLAILAAMLGATDVTGIDNDEWSVENALENLQRNDREAIAIHQATLDEIPEREYDVILANINRHILLQYMDGLYTRIRKGGQLLMSGLLTEDEPIMLEAAMAAGFAVDKVAHRNGWISILCNKL